MSPSEFDLRAALHDGEGDPVDAGAIISAGRARAARRRNQVRTGVAALAVVAGLVGVGAIVFSGNDSNRFDTSAGGANSAPTTHAGSARAPAAAGPAVSRSAGAGAAASAPSAADDKGSLSTRQAAPAASAAPLRCPAAAPAVPGASAGASPTAPMFAKPVASVVICSYAPGATSSSTPRSVTISGIQARRFAASLENAATTRAPGLCPAYVRADQRTIRVLASSTDATTLAPVVATLNAAPCRVMATNGTAVRYAWTPPAALRTELQPLVGAPSYRPKQGSPARS